MLDKLLKKCVRNAMTTDIRKVANGGAGAREYKGLIAVWNTVIIFVNKKRLVVEKVVLKIENAFLLNFCIIFHFEYFHEIHTPIHMYYAYMYERLQYIIRSKKNNCLYMHVCMYICIYEYMYVCMYVCMYVHICVHFVILILLLIKKSY